MGGGGGDRERGGREGGRGVGRGGGYSEGQDEPPVKGGRTKEHHLLLATIQLSCMCVYIYICIYIYIYIYIYSCLGVFRKEYFRLITKH